MADLELETIGRVRLARLNRPDKKNAQSEEMLELLSAALREADEDPGVGCFVITGAGDAFCSGGDLGRRSKEQEVRDPTPLERKERLSKFSQRVARAVELFEKPLIAAVNGAAVGAGMDMALMCDLRVASASARFSEGYIRVGLLPGNGGCYFLPRVVGMSKALELLWTGDFVPADEALRLGMVSYVYPDAELMTRALELAQRIADGPPVHLRDIKKLTYQAQRTDLLTSLEAVSAHMAVVQSTEDYKEAIKAFKEKRKPVFKGR